MLNLSEFSKFIYLIIKGDAFQILLNTDFQEKGTNKSPFHMGSFQ